MIDSVLTLFNCVDIELVLNCASGLGCDVSGME